MMALIGLWILLQQDPLTEGKAVPITDKWTFGGSRLLKTRCLRIRDEESWRMFWKKHADAEEKLPEVDFQSRMVLVYLERMVKPGHVELVSVRETQEFLRIIVDPQGPQVMGNPPEHTSYVIVVVPRSRKPVRFTLQYSELKGSPLKYKDLLTLQDKEE